MSRIIKVEFCRHEALANVKESSYDAGMFLLKNERINISSGNGGELVKKHWMKPQLEVLDVRMTMKFPKDDDCPPEEVDNPGEASPFDS